MTCQEGREFCLRGAVEGESEARGGRLPRGRRRSVVRQAKSASGRRNRVAPRPLAPHLRFNRFAWARLVGLSGKSPQGGLTEQPLRPVLAKYDSRSVDKSPPVKVPIHRHNLFSCPTLSRQRQYPAPPGPAETASRRGPPAPAQGPSPRVCNPIPHAPRS